jgi:DNA polymerase-3 subunit delta
MDSATGCGRYIPRMASPLGALTRALETGEFEHVYLFHGDDDFLKEEMVRALVERATDAGTRDFNLDVWRAGDLDLASIGTALDSLPMLAAHRVLVIRDAAALARAPRLALTNYLRKPSPAILLVLVVGAGTKPDASLLADAAAIEFTRLGDEAVRAWVARRASSLGAPIESRAIELLCQAVGSDLGLLAGELDKLRSYANGSTIVETDVTADVGVRHDETVAAVLDAVGTRNGGRASSLIASVLTQPKTTGVSVLMALTTQMLAIGWALAARADGLAQHHLERELFGLLKENSSSLVGRPWGEGVKAWVRALRHWDHASVDRALELLLAADAALKDTRVSSEEQLLATLVLGMTAGRAHSAAA